MGGGVENDDDDVRMVATIVMVSGKRCSGKDYFADQFEQVNEMRDNPVIVHRIPSAHLVKVELAKSSGGAIDLQRLMHDREYKDLHRDQLISLAEGKKRDISPSYWIEQGVQQFHQICNTRSSDNDKPIVFLVTDFRFKDEYDYVRENTSCFNVFYVRVNASESTRKSRGWVYKEAVDAHSSEVDLDNMVSIFDHVLENNQTEQENQHMLSTISDLIDKCSLHCNNKA